MGARLYDPTTTTFLSPDPLTPPAGALWANNLVTGAPTSIDGRPVLPLPGGRILGATPIGDTNLWREVMPTDPDNPYQPTTVAIEGVPETIRMAGNALVVDGHPWWERASTTQLPPPFCLLTR